VDLSVFNVRVLPVIHCDMLLKYGHR